MKRENVYKNKYLVIEIEESPNYITLAFGGLGREFSFLREEFNEGLADKLKGKQVDVILVNEIPMRTKDIRLMYFQDELVYPVPSKS